MKLTCNQSDLQKAIQVASRFLPSQPFHPILGGILVSTEKNQITITTFDLSKGGIFSCSAEVSSKGRCVVPAVFSQIVSCLPKGKEVEIVTDNTQLTLTSASGQYHFPLLPASDFPQLPKVKGKTIVLPCQLLAECCRATAFAACLDEYKQVLTGVRITLEENEGEPCKLEFAATDGYRISVFTVFPEGGLTSSYELAITIPSKTAHELERLLRGTEEETVAMELDDKNPLQVSFFLGDNIEIVSRLIDGGYPNYQALIPRPEDANCKLSINRRQLIESLNRVSVLSDAKYHRTNWSFSEDKLFIAASTSDMGSGKDEIPCQITGSPPPKLSLNFKLLREGLLAIQGEEVIIHIGDAKQPIVLRNTTQTHTYLLMPIQVNSKEAG